MRPDRRWLALAVMLAAPVLGAAHCDGHVEIGPPNAPPPGEPLISCDVDGDGIADDCD